MKKFALLILFFISTTVVFSQRIFTNIQKYDKFDDVVWSRTVKTLISVNDTSIIIETKGQQPEEFRYVDAEFFCNHIGRKDSLVNLVADVWGYETQYKVLTDSKIMSIGNEIIEDFKDKPDSLKTESAIRAYAVLKVLHNLDELPTIVIRTVSSSRYTFKYEAELVWIKYPDGSRTIYTIEY